MGKAKPSRSISAMCSRDLINDDFCAILDMNADMLPLLSLLSLFCGLFNVLVEDAGGAGARPIVPGCIVEVDDDDDEVFGL